MRFSLLPEVRNELSLPRWSILYFSYLSFFSLFPQVESAPQYDLHKYMTRADLQLHFGIDSIERVPDYDLSTPSYKAPYRSFSHYAQKRGWVHPSELRFDIEVFNTKYSIHAVRNDALVSPEFYYQVHHGLDHRTSSHIPPRSVTSGHYLSRVKRIYPEDERSAESTRGALSTSAAGLQGLFDLDNQLYRLVPLRPNVARRYLANFDTPEQFENLRIIYPVASKTVQNLHTRFTRSLNYPEEYSEEDYEFQRDQDRRPARREENQSTRPKGGYAKAQSEPSRDRPRKPSPRDRDENGPIRPKGGYARPSESSRDHPRNSDSRRPDREDSRPARPPPRDRDREDPRNMPHRPPPHQSNFGPPPGHGPPHRGPPPPRGPPDHRPPPGHHNRGNINLPPIIMPGAPMPPPPHHGPPPHRGPPPPPRRPLPPHNGPPLPPPPPVNRPPPHRPPRPPPHPPPNLPPPPHPPPNRHHERPPPDDSPEERPEKPGRPPARKKGRPSPERDRLPAGRGNGPPRRKRPLNQERRRPQKPPRPPEEPMPRRPRPPPPPRDRPSRPDRPRARPSRPVSGNPERKTNHKQNEKDADDDDDDDDDDEEKETQKPKAKPTTTTVKTTKKRPTKATTRTTTTKTTTTTTTTTTTKKPIPKTTAKKPTPKTTTTTQKPKHDVFPLRAVISIYPVVDYSYYSALEMIGIKSKETKTFLVLAMYNEVQAFYKASPISNKVDMIIEIGAVEFITTEKNKDVTPDPYATNYLHNLCSGPLNSPTRKNVDHVQALTMLDLFELNPTARLKKRSADETFDLENEEEIQFDNKTTKSWYSGNITDSSKIPEAKRVYDAVGLALLGSTCSFKHHCSVIEMASFTPSINIAHELAHALGMQHEGSNGCLLAENPTSFVIPNHPMKSGWSEFAQPPSVSTCAVEELVNYLKGDGKCLLKSPVKDSGKFYQTHLKGLLDKKVLTADEVCKAKAYSLFKRTKRWKDPQVFAEKPDVPEICKSLVCGAREKDSTEAASNWVFGPAPTATRCDKTGDKVCFNFKCVPKTDLGTSAGKNSVLG